VEERKSTRSKIKVLLLILERRDENLCDDAAAASAAAACRCCCCVSLSRVEAQPRYFIQKSSKKDPRKSVVRLVWTDENTP
jgi:hypothetical protein